MAYTKHRVELSLGGRTLSIETGHLAKQADGAALVQYGETVVLGTVVRGEPRPGADFFPLTVDYREKLSAAGKFPAGFKKREGAPAQKETLTMRNIDRPLRPMFPKGFLDEVQVQCWVLAYDGQHEPDVLAGIAASAALTLSSIPFEGPVGNVRVGRVDGELVVMPTLEQDAYSDIDLLLCGGKDGVNMIEVGAYQVPEADLIEAVKFGHQHILKITAKIAELAAKAGKPKTGTIHAPSDALRKLCADKLGPALKAAKTAPGTKLERAEAVKAAKKAFFSAECPEPGDAATAKQLALHAGKVKQAKLAAEELEETLVRELTRGGARTDGRKAAQLRDIECLAGVLPRVHGSALFTRGETQALVTATLGTGKDEQVVDGLNEEYAEKFFLHYNFPPFAVGETKRIGEPGRREIGHGKLAERALLPILPDIEEFPYTVRLVADILESNGSSSMAAACGGTLALMDAGVPIKAPVAGVSVGLIGADGPGQKELFLADIQGEEDRLGDMDFKVCGTRDGVTAVQVDLKIKGLSLAQIEKAFKLARESRLKILDLMAEALPAPRQDLAPHAPRMLRGQVHPDKIAKIIGPGGQTIRALEEATGAKIEIEEDGTLYVSAIGPGKVEAAAGEIEKLCAEVHVGAIYTGRVTGLKDFGAFIELIPGQDGLCHVSELTESYVEKVSDILSVGQEVRVKVVSVDEQGRVKVSRKAAMKDEGTAEDPAILAKIEAKKAARQNREGGAKREGAPRRENGPERGRNGYRGERAPREAQDPQAPVAENIGNEA